MQACFVRRVESTVPRRSSVPAVNRTIQEAVCSPFIAPLNFSQRVVARPLLPPRFCSAPTTYHPIHQSDGKNIREFGNPSHLGQMICMICMICMIYSYFMI